MDFKCTDMSYWNAAERELHKYTPKNCAERFARVSRNKSKLTGGDVICWRKWVMMMGRTTRN